MTNLKEIKKTEEQNLLIVFADLTNFARISNNRSSNESFEYISNICEMTGDLVESAGGTVIKFIGDESLSVFPESRIDAGIAAMLKLKQKIDNFNKQNKLESQLKVKCHFGTTTLGLLGSKTDKKLDVIGNEVNTCAMLKSNGFAMTAETFRKLKT
jgi:adenylate cyclase